MSRLPGGIKKIELTSRKDGRAEVRYVVTVDVGSNGERKQVQKRFKTEADARKFQTDALAQARSGMFVLNTEITVDQACAGWLLSKHGIKPSTKRGYEVWLRPVREEFGDVELSKLTKSDLDDLVQRLYRGEVVDHGKWTPRSVNGFLGIFRAILESEVKQGHLVRNVAKLVDRLPSEKTEMKTLTEAEMFKILDYPHPNRHLWALALYGLRRGEIAGLRWDNVDFQKKTITITENRVAVGRQIVSGTPKSLRSRRVLPMPDEVLDILRDAYGKYESEYVACDEQGNPMHPNLLTFRWGKLLEELAIQHVRLHDARHSCATLMHLRGVPVAVIAAWMGHSSAAFTLATYAHSQEDALAAAAQSFRL